MAVCRLAHTQDFPITILVGWRTQATLLPLQPAYWCSGEAGTIPFPCLQSKSISSCGQSWQLCAGSASQNTTPEPWCSFLTAQVPYYHSKVSRGYYEEIQRYDLRSYNEQTEAILSDLWYFHLAVLFRQIDFPGNSASAGLNFKNCNSLSRWTNAWNSPWVLLPHAPAIMNTKAYFSDLNLLKI